MEIKEEKVCDEEWELLDKWFNQWAIAERTEGTRNPQWNTMAIGTQANAKTKRLTTGLNMEKTSLAIFLRPLLNETRDPEIMYRADTHGN